MILLPSFLSNNSVNLKGHFLEIITFGPVQLPSFLTQYFSTLDLIIYNKNYFAKDIRYVYYTHTETY